jgi:hypothetical protein
VAQIIELAAVKQNRHAGHIGTRRTLAVMPLALACLRRA